MKRIYFKSSAKELEDVFRVQGNNPEVLKSLLDELQHRSTPKAASLKQKVAKALSDIKEGSSVSLGNRKAPVQNGLFPAPEPTLAPESRPTAKQIKVAEPQKAAQEEEKAPYSEEFKKPEIFKRVEPRGVRGRPEKKIYDLKKNLELPFAETDPVTKKYRVALRALIVELKRRGAGSQDLSLENGQRIPLDGKGIGYTFPFIEEGNIFEGASIQLVVGSRRSEGQIVSLMPGKIIVSIDDDYGDAIHACVLRIDNTSLLDALERRLGEVENGEISHFNKQMAENVIFNKSSFLPPASPLSSSEFKKLDEQKKKAVCAALTNSVVYIWGPPGSGKTTCIGFLIQYFYEEGKRILICSNTNQAVDQVILKLCRGIKDSNNMSPLEDGVIIRSGKITHSELEHQFSSYVTVQGVVERKSKELVERREKINEILERIARTASKTEKILQLFLRYDGLVKELLSKIQKAEIAVGDLKGAIRNVADAKERLKNIADEYRKFQKAGLLKRLILRSEDTILNDQRYTQSLIERLTAERPNYEDRLEKLKAEVGELKAAKDQMEASLSQHDRRALEEKAKEFDSQREPLHFELNEINRKMEDIQRTVMEQAKIVGATVSKVYLSRSDFSSFDIVIIDEASMIPAPMLYYAAGMAKEKCLISGDFQQLAPIIQTDQKAIFETIGRSVFETAGVSKLVENSQGEIPDGKTIMLNEQFRMDDSICSLITTNFYRGWLRTASERRPPAHAKPPAPYQGNLTLVDTSRIWPFSNRDAFKSRYNLMHALAIRNLCLHLQESGFIEGRGSVGICTPYAAQAKIHRKIMEGHGLSDIDAGTVHRYQGDEKVMMVLDIPDSVGDYGVGLFLQANTLDDAGAKLFNVAISRAKEHLVVFANLTYLDDKLPGDSFLRDILFQMQERGTVIDVQDVIALRPIYEGLEKLQHNIDVDLEGGENGLFNQKDFTVVCMADLAQAQKSITIFSGFITPQRVASYGDLFRQKINEGVKIRSVTRPPANNGSIPEEDGRRALQALEGMGVVIDLRQKIHEKVVLIDDQIVWFGSLNPLSHTSATAEMMARLENQETTLQVASFLALGRSSAVDMENGKSAVKENPTCPSCGTWTVYKTGRYGPYFDCEKVCGWKESFDKPKGDSDKKPIDLTGYTVPDTPPTCDKPGCGASMALRQGRFGPFYGCSAYPKCNGIANLKKKSVTTKRRKK